MLAQMPHQGDLALSLFEEDGEGPWASDTVTRAHASPSQSRRHESHDGTMGKSLLGAA